MKTVFLSSTSKDLQAHRDDICEYLHKLVGIHCIRMEDFGAIDNSSINVCTEKVAECDLFIGILGNYYGNTYEGKSYCEHEYETAVRSELYKLMFIESDDNTLDDIEEPQDNKDSLIKFKEKVIKGTTYDTFNCSGDLTKKVLTAIFNWKEQGGISVDINPGSYSVTITGPHTQEVYYKLITERDSLYISPNDGELHIKDIRIYDIDKRRETYFDLTAGKFPIGLNFERISYGSYRPKLNSEYHMAINNEPRFEEIESGVYALLLEPDRTNILLDSENPADQCVPILRDGYYTIWMEGEGTVQVFAMNLVHDGMPKATAIENESGTFMASKHETLKVIVKGNIKRFQLEDGSYPTSYIKTSTGTATRTADLVEPDVNNG